MSRPVLAPTTAISDRTWTVEHAETLTPRGRCEILGGVLYLTGPPRWPVPELVANLLMLLAAWVRAHRLGKVYPPQTGIYLNETNYLDPDLVFLRPDQRPRKGQRTTRAALAVEVLSPSNLRAPREEREQLFQQAGVEELWYVDYDTRSLEVRRLAEAGYETSATFREGDPVSSRLFPGLEFPLEAAWADVEE